MPDFYFPAFDEFDLDDEERSLCEYFLRLQCLIGKAESEFDYVVQCSRDIETLDIAIDQEFAAMADGVADGMIIYTPGLSAAELREQSAMLLSETAAGSLILMLDDVMQRLRTSVWNRTTKSPNKSRFALGALPDGRGHVATALWAAGNSYRHAKDWEGLVDAEGRIDNHHAQLDAARSTLNVLERLTGLHAVYTESVCTRTAFVLADDSAIFDVLWRKLRDAGQDFAEQYCKDEDAYARVAEALETLHIYNSMEVSYTRNDALFAADNGDA